MDQPQPIRASDADRERAVDELRAHCAEGRITPDEFAERVDAVYSSKTDIELRAVASDLPVSRGSGPAELSRVERSRRRLKQDAGGAGIAALACVGVWVAAGAHGSFWPIWVILAVSLRLARDGWRLMGPAADLEPGPRELERRARRAERRRLRSR
ncbi:MAG: DUF1707 SHOCT-like domain-containing protein [Solirubrobacteraceae bacterium]